MRNRLRATLEKSQGMNGIMSSDKEKTYKPSGARHFLFPKFFFLKKKKLEF
jgi:hypothetical protein